MCPASPFTGVPGGHGRGELARLMNGIALSAQQHRTHAVKGVRGVEPKVANVGQGLVSAGLGLQSTEDFGRMGLLDEKRADPTLNGMVGGVGVRPGKAMAMDVLTGHKQLQPLLFVQTPMRARPVLLLRRPRCSGLLSLCLPRQAGFEVKRRGLLSSEHGPSTPR